MDGFLYWIGIGCLSGALLALLAAAKNYLNVRSEFARAARAGEIAPAPGGEHVPLFKIIFETSALPQAEASRRRLVRDLGTFLCLCVLTTTVAAADCAQPATSMNEPWFWLLTLAVVAILVSGKGDIMLPARRRYGYFAIAVSAAMAVAHLYMYSLYTARLPAFPQPATGNLLPFNDRGSLVFINPWQSSMLIWLQFGAVVLALCGAVIVRYAGERETRK